MMELSDTILKEDHQRTIPAPSLDYIGWVLSEENILKLILSKIAYFAHFRPKSAKRFYGSATSVTCAMHLNETKLLFKFQRPWLSSYIFCILY
jgi:hypothetical protein